MKKALITAAVLAAASLPGFAADVGVSIGISQPGVYGRIDIGRFPQPVLMAPTPVVVSRPWVVAPEPVYLWVPPGHQKNWNKHCSRYNACGVPVYFVQDRWYNEHVRVDNRHDRRDDRYDHRDDRRDDRHDDKHGNKHGNKH